jgi:hypothetical protein
MIIIALMTVYPNHQWNIAQFKHVPQGYWKEVNNHKAFMEDLKKSLNIQKMEDWYFVTAQQLKQHGGSIARKYAFSVKKCKR